MGQRLHILLTWEFGGALGHLARLRPLSARLAARGHRVTMALRPSRHAAKLPSAYSVVPVPTPTTAQEPIRQPVSIADVLYNHGAGDAKGLAAQLRSWDGLLQLASPDMVVMDYSPTALLACQGKNLRTMLLGTGFACPPAVEPLPDLRDWESHYSDRIIQTEQQVLSALNSRLRQEGLTPLSYVGELFARSDANVLATFPELDHYPQRTGGDYWGTWSDLGGAHPDWPVGKGPRIFAYLKPFRGLPAVLRHLRSRGIPTLAFIEGRFDATPWQGPTLRVVDRPMDMGQVARDCDAALLHAGHGSTAEMLLAGKPLIQIPVHVEQFHNAVNTERLGAGRHVSLSDPKAICAAIGEVLQDDRFRENAASFAARHRHHDPDKQVEELANYVESLALTPHHTSFGTDVRR